MDKMKDLRIIICFLVIYKCKLVFISASLLTDNSVGWLLVVVRIIML